MKISYGITVHNEAEELKRLLNILTDKIDKEDEIVICIDGDDEKVESVVGEYLSENKLILELSKEELMQKLYKPSRVDRYLRLYNYDICQEIYCEND